MRMNVFKTSIIVNVILLPTNNVNILHNSCKHMFNLNLRLDQLNLQNVSEICRGDNLSCSKLKLSFLR